MSLPPSDLVPVLSFIRLGARCRYCGAHLRWELLSIELAAATIAVFCALLFRSPALIGFAAILGWACLTLAWIDARHFYLPDVVTLPLIIAGFAATWLVNPETLPAHAIGTVVGYFVFWCLNEAYRKIRGRDGLGMGDAKLMGLAGAWLGWQALPWVVVTAAIIGILLAFALRILEGRELNHVMRLPFGTCLAPVIFVAFLIEASV